MNKIHITSSLLVANSYEPKEKINLNFTAYSMNLKQNLKNLFSELNRMDFIIGKQMYNDALKLFHVQIRQVQKGHLVFVPDGIGNPIRHPIRMPHLSRLKPIFIPTMFI